MKILLIPCFVVLNFMANAQNRADYDPVFEKSSWYLNTGFSFGYYRYEFTGNREIKILPTTVSLERALSDEWSVGVYLGYAKWEYLADFDLEFISFGGRISWHMLPKLKDWVDLDLNPSRWDLYLSGIFGFEYRLIDEWYGGVGPFGNDKNFIIGPLAGLRYFFNPRLGFFVEGGRGAFGYGTAGVVFKF